MVSAKFWFPSAMNKKTTWILALGVWLGSQAWASGLDTLEAFLKNTQSARADFTQVVTSPAKPGQAARVKKSTGTFAFLRPSKFRFDYQKPFAQTIVADGQTLWLYDADLEQVTARQQSQALGSTPAALIATASSVASLEKDFVLQAQPDAQGLQWVLASPKNREGSLQSVRIGLSQEGATTRLEKLEILDALGQNSVLSFERFQVNPSTLNTATFVFVPPKGVDVIRP